jgi:hypothetical protein
MNQVTLRVTLIYDSVYLDFGLGASRRGLVEWLQLVVSDGAIDSGVGRRMERQ